MCIQEKAGGRRQGKRQDAEYERQKVQTKLVTHEAIIRGLVRDTSTSCVVVMLVMVVGGGEGLVMRMVIYEATIRGLVRDASASAHFRLVEG